MTDREELKMTDREELKRRFREGNWRGHSKAARWRALQLIDSCIDDLPFDRCDLEALEAVGRRAALRVRMKYDFEGLMSHHGTAVPLNSLGRECFLVSYIQLIALAEPIPF